MREVKVRRLPVQKRLMECGEYFAGIYSSRAAGKTYVLSVLAVKWLCEGMNVMVWAQTFRALDDVLFAEIKGRLAEWGLAYKVKVNESKRSVTMGAHFIRCFSYENVNAARGETRIRRVLFDEISQAPVSILAVVIPCMRACGGKPLVRFASTPLLGSFWDHYLFDPKNRVTVFRGSIFENSFVTNEEIEAMKRAITDETLYRQEILGEVIEDADSTRIVRVQDFVNEDIPQNQTDDVYVGVDCAGLGTDSNVIKFRNGNRVLFTYKVKEADGPFLAEKVEELQRLLPGRLAVKEINIDMAYGQSVYDCLKHKACKVNLCAFGSAPQEERYANRRAEMYFRLAEAVRDGLHVTSDAVREELLATHYTLTRSGKILLQPKEEIRDMIGRSPDESDALALTFFSSRSVREQFVSRTLRDSRRSRTHCAMGD